MKFLFQRPDQALRLATPGFFAGPDTGFGENVAAGFDAMWASGMTTSGTHALTSVYTDYLRDVQRQTAVDLDLVPPTIRGAVTQGDLGKFTFGFLGESQEEAITREEESLYQQLSAMKAQFPRLVVRSPAELRAMAIERAKAQLAGANDVMGRATGLGIAGQFAGGMGAAMIDPPNAVAMIASMGVGAPGVFANAALQGGFNAAVEAANQVQVSEWQKKIGIDYGWRDFAMYVGFAGGAGAAFPLAGFGIRKGIAAIRGRPVTVPARSPGSAAPPAGTAAPALPSAIDPLDQLAAAMPTRVEAGFGEAAMEVPATVNLRMSAALRRAMDTREVAERNPMVDTPGARNEHRERLADVTAAIGRGDPIDVREMPLRPLAASDGTPRENLDGILWTFKPSEIGVDAATFQFKAGADEAGVTDRLAGVTAWDQTKAGQILVYEYGDGRLFVADGHQRVALAKRLEAEGQQAKLFGIVLREQDGITPEMARTVAAAKNIAEGTGSAVDAAKVLRFDPSQLKGLPPRSELVRIAKELAKLSDSAFGMVINDAVPPGYAAIVGRLVADERLHPAMLELLAKTQPANQVQAESIVRQAIDAGSTVETQATLFGEEQLAQTLYAERARVMDGAVKRLRSDKAVFNTLTRDASRIESAGNKLAAATNASEKDAADRALAVLLAAANRKGPLSDALTNAARRYAGDGKLGPAADAFVSAVRDAARRGDFDGASAGADVRSVGLAGEGDAQRIAAEIKADEAELMLFGDPEPKRGTSAGGDQQTKMMEADIASRHESDPTAAERLVPVDQAVDEDGNPVPVVMSEKDMLAHFEADREFIETLELCVMGGASNVAS